MFFGEDAYGNFSTPVKYYFRKNLQRDIVAIYDEDGNLQVRYTYDAWGNMTASYASGYDTAVTANSFYYRSYYRDSETGLYYLNSRFYDPNWGRFLNADDQMSKNQDFSSYNLFAFYIKGRIMYEKKFLCFYFACYLLCFKL